MQKNLTLKELYDKYCTLIGTILYDSKGTFVLLDLKRQEGLLFMFIRCEFNWPSYLSQFTNSNKDFLVDHMKDIALLHREVEKLRKTQVKIETLLKNRSQ